MTNQHPDFYHICGPFLARREIAREIGEGILLNGVIWDDDEKQWFVALDGSTVAGFATMLFRSANVIDFCEAYVLPAYRNQKIHNQLIDERIHACPVGSVIHVVVCASSVHQYESRGFIIKRQRGKDYIEMTKGKGIGDIHE